MSHTLHKETQTKMTKGLLDMIIFELLRHEDMHGYQIISNIRKTYGVYFGPSSIYPMLSFFEKKGYIKSVWNMDSVRPRKVYTLTQQGKDVLEFYEHELNMICRSLVGKNENRIAAVVPQMVPA